MIATDRKEVREAFAQLVRTNVTAAQEVFEYLVADFVGKSPVIVVASGGRQPKPFTNRGTRPVHYLDVHTFVAYAESNGAWTEKDAEDMLDQLATALDAVVAANQKNAKWEAITQDEQSRTDSEIVAGVEYRREITRYRFE